MEDGGQSLGKFKGGLVYMEDKWSDHAESGGVSQIYFPVI